MSAINLLQNKNESLARDIYNWCIKNGLWMDVCIYFNGKAWSSSRKWSCVDGKKIDEDLYEYHDKNPLSYFEYGNPETVSISFEGGLNHILNGYSTGCYDLAKEFRELFRKYDYYFEMGNSWNGAAYNM